MESLIFEAQNTTLQGTVFQLNDTLPLDDTLVLTADVAYDPNTGLNLVTAGTYFIELDLTLDAATAIPDTFNVTDEEENIHLVSTSRFEYSEDRRSVTITSSGTVKIADATKITVICTSNTPITLALTPIVAELSIYGIDIVEIPDCDDPVGIKRVYA